MPKETMQTTDRVYGGASVQELNKWADVIEAQQSKMEKIRGDMSADYKSIEENGIHKKAFKDALKIRAMAADEARDYLKALHSYIDGFGVSEQLDLFYDEFVPEKVTLEKKEEGSLVDAVVANMNAEKKAASASKAVN